MDTISNVRVGPVPSPAAAEFAVSIAPSLWFPDTELRVFDAVTGALKHTIKLRVYGGITQMAWDPSGTRIAFVTYASCWFMCMHTSTVYVATPATGDVVKLAEFNVPGVHVEWVLDDKSLAMARHQRRAAYPSLAITP